MGEYGFLALAVGTAVVVFGAYFLQGPLERWHERLERDLKRLRAGPSSGEGEGEGE